AFGIRKRDVSIAHIIASAGATAKDSGPFASIALLVSSPKPLSSTPRSPMGPLALPPPRSRGSQRPAEAHLVAKAELVPHLACRFELLTDTVDRGRVELV